MRITFNKIASLLATGVSLLFVSTLNFAAENYDKDTIEQGKYMAVASDCVACHTTQEGKYMAGGLGVATPLGKIFSTNITPSKKYGIGDYSLKDFEKAVRQGIRKDGQRLYPAMPYTAYSYLSDKDIEALYAYFMNDVDAVDEKSPKTDLPFPFNIRLSMAIWNSIFLNKEPFKHNDNESDEWNRGAYLVEGAAHCSTCHTPRNLLMAESDKKAFAGASLGNWYAPNITPDEISGIGNWSKQDIVDYLKTGKAKNKAAAAGPMLEAVDHSFRHMTDSDLQAIATYIQSIPAYHNKGDKKAKSDWGKPSNELASIRGDKKLPKNPDDMTGQQLYAANCASCHQPSGEGQPERGIPSLFSSTTTGNNNADNLIMVMLDGISWESKKDGLVMPSFRNNLSDKQLATLGNYVLQHYGNNKTKPIDIKQVSKLRANKQNTSLVTLAWVGITAVVVIILLILVLIFRRKKH